MPQTILVVDDDASLRRLYERALGNQGYALTLASGTGEARALMERNSYDLLITDLELGDGLGTELIKIARAAADSKTKVILVTGSLGEQDLRHIAEKYRLPGYFAKPFRIDAFMKAVKEALLRPD